MPRRKQEGKYVGQFLQDAHREAFQPEEAILSAEWEGNMHHREFARWHDWVRRTLEECCWWELDDSAKNINKHLQVRLASVYKEALEYRELDQSVVPRLPRMPKQTGVEPKEDDWSDWYYKKQRDSRRWYQHWTSHIMVVSPYGHQTNIRTMRIREIWQLFLPYKPKVEQKTTPSSN